MPFSRKLVLRMSTVVFAGLGLLLVFQNCAGGIDLDNPGDLTEQSSYVPGDDVEPVNPLSPSVDVVPATELVQKSIRNFDLTFHKRTGALLKIHHQTAGLLLQTLEGDEGLFSIGTPVVNYLPLSLDTANSTMSQEILEDQLFDGRRRLRLFWKNLRTPADRKSTGLDEVSIGVIVEIIESPAPAEGLQFRLHLQNRAMTDIQGQKVSVAQVLFPDLRGLRRLTRVGQSSPNVDSFQAVAFDRTTNPFVGPAEDQDRTLFYPMATWERVLLPTVATDADGFAIKTAEGTLISRVFNYSRHYLGLMSCAGNGVFLTEQAASDATLLPAEELMYSRDATGPEGLRVTWRRPLAPIEQQKLLDTAGWWFTPIVSLTVSMNGQNCP